MREYGRVRVSFWTDPAIRALSDDAKALLLYLNTCEHNTIIGAFRLPLAYACDDLQWTPERFKKGFKALEEAGLAIYCRETRWVCIVRFLAENPPENPNQQKAVIKALEALPETCFAEGLRNGSPTVPKHGVGEGTGVGEEGSAESAVRFQVIVDAYHAHLPNCAHVEALTDERLRAVKRAETNARRICKSRGWRYGPDFWDDYFRECAKDPWLRGDVPNPKNARWKQNLDVLLRDEHFAKLMDAVLATIPREAP